MAPPYIDHIGFPGGMINRHLALFFKVNNLGNNLLTTSQQLNQLMIEIVYLPAQMIQLRLFLVLFQMIMLFHIALKRDIAGKMGLPILKLCTDYVESEAMFTHKLVSLRF